MTGLKLGLNLGYWAGRPPEGVAEKVAEAERLGFDSLWTSEAYGSDGLTPLAWWGAATRRMRLGTAIAQMAARTPAATAMAALTLDHLSDGRFVLGLGASGPQVVEGWYGQPFTKPLARTREYVEIVRRIVRRDEPVTFAGEHYQLPYPGGTGLGKPLRSSLHPRRTDLPIYLGAEGPKNVALAAEIADGWITVFYSPHDDRLYRDALAAGFARRATAAGDGGRRTEDGGRKCSGYPDERVGTVDRELTGGKGAARPGEPRSSVLRPAQRSSVTDPRSSFEVVALVHLVVDADVERAADQIRPTLALYVGGMGARSANFHYNAIARLGFEGECARIQELYLGGRKNDAIAAVPTKMVEAVALVGPIEKIRDDLVAWRDSLVTTLVIDGSPGVLRQMADLLLGGG